MIAHIALPLPIDKTFSYIVPEEMAPSLHPLLRVKVSFGHRSLVGFVISIEDDEGVGLKSIEEILDCRPLIYDKCFRLCRWTSDFYVAPLGVALKFALPGIGIEKYSFVRTEDGDLARINNMTLKKASALLGRATILDCLSKARIRLVDPMGSTIAAFEELQAPGSGFQARLLWAGIEERSEAYLSLISEQITQGKNVLMLLPDYLLSGGYLYRLLLRHFPGSVFWYSTVTPERKRAETYFRARTETGRLILGNKSAVFLHVRNIGLILVERPEEDEYRNEEAFRFNTVRVALERARIEDIPLLLGSIAPPVELMKRAIDSELHLTKGTRLVYPVISIMYEARGAGDNHIPINLVEMIKKTISNGGNVVIHTPRRAYATQLRCAACHKSFACPACSSVSLTYSRETESLICNNCRGLFPYKEECVNCGSTFIRFFNVGAEYLYTHLQMNLPDTPVHLITGDPKRQRNVKSIANKTGGNGSVFVGTHVLSKLYDLQASLLILHGWDNPFRSGGFRGPEKAFQILHNLIDALKPQEMIYCTEEGQMLDPMLLLQADRFYDEELRKREAADFPPYRRVFLINVQKRKEKTGERVVGAIEKAAQESNLDKQIFGPIELKGQYGWRLILNVQGDEKGLSSFFSSLYRLPGVHIEADPLHF